MLLLLLSGCIAFPFPEGVALCFKVTEHPHSQPTTKQMGTVEIRQGDSDAEGREDQRSPGQMGSMDGFLSVVTTLARNKGLARSPSIGRPSELFPAELTPDPWVTVLTQGRLRNELEKLSHGFESYPWGGGGSKYSSCVTFFEIF